MQTPGVLLRRALPGHRHGKHQHVQPRVVEAAKRRIETALAEKVADSGRFGWWPPAAQMAGTPCGAGISGKKKGPEISESWCMVVEVARIELASGSTQPSGLHA